MTPRDGQTVSEGVTEVRLDRELVPGVVRKPHPTAPGYVEVSMDPDALQTLAGPPIDNPRQDTGQVRYMLGGQIRFVRLQAAREAASMSAAELSKATGLPVAVVEAIESENEVASDRDMRLIAAALRCDVDHAFPWTVPFGPKAAPAKPAPLQAGTSTPPPAPPVKPAADLADDVVAAEARNRRELKRETATLGERIRRLGR
jgi:transcriptional regulator with XRE-family HTH domain